MKATPCEYGLESIIGNSGPRSGGLHISAIYNDLYSELEPNRYRKGSKPDPVLLELGLSCESWLEDGLKNRLMSGWERPGELVGEIDGHEVSYNPDLVKVNGVLRLGEIKLTQMSAKGFPTAEANNLPEKMSKYVVQMMAYAHLLHTTYARLIVYFVNGDYNRVVGGDPQIRACDLEFAPREIADNWAMLVQHGRHKNWEFDH